MCTVLVITVHIPELIVILARAIATILNFEKNNNKAIVYSYLIYYDHALSIQNMMPVSSWKLCGNISLTRQFTTHSINQQEPHFYYLQGNNLPTVRPTYIITLSVSMPTMPNPGLVLFSCFL